MRVRMGQVGLLEGSEGKDGAGKVVGGEWG